MLFSLGGFVGYKLRKPSPQVVEKVVYQKGETKTVDRVIEREVNVDGSSKEVITEKELSQTDTNATSSKIVKDVDGGQYIPRHSIRVLVNPLDRYEFTFGYGYKLLGPISVEAEYVRLHSEKTGLIGFGFEF
jgi:outer membrane protein assembly factor BamA